ncbi:methyltransferase-like protein 24 [Plakobranchus ocellatus]|uniref:Methyltransferase-like protein 24 n=1 Tax=Plakobranchus ocellatus TaxID=259542 RepID=A0AAV4CS58_9GAST|nr:methyltransferase-like protein 24 [Plakobranchus ocellatus]
MRKRSLLTGLCFLTLLYAGVQFYIQDDYSPLQLLSSVENEASRLLKFISQPHLHCNDSLATGNTSRWLICLDFELGVPSLKSEDQKSVVYSIGPQKEHSFEHFVSWNLSAAKLYIFCHEKCMGDAMNTNPSKTTFYSAVIVPNDPADFARNSFQSQTLNTVMKSLHHDSIQILKLDSFIDSVQSYEVLRFLIDDSLLQSVQELHFVVKLDKLEEDFIYSWYRVLYALFTTAGFRLFHTSASDMLCLQDTVMESCSYHLSWVKKPPPHVFVMYPPAIDGSKENEEDRLLSYIQNSKSNDVSFTTVSIKMDFMNSRTQTHQDLLSIDLASNLFEKNNQRCQIIVIRNSAYKTINRAPIKGCNVFSFAFSSQKDGSALFQFVHNGSRKKRKAHHVELEEILTSSSKNIMFIDLQDNWDMLFALSNRDLPRLISQLIVQGNIFPASGRFTHMTLRTRYSELKCLEEFGLSLVKVDKVAGTNLKFSSSGDIYSLNFLKNFDS